jgi:hypothetical protein
VLKFGRFDAASEIFQRRLQGQLDAMPAQSPSGWRASTGPGPCGRRDCRRCRTRPPEDERLRIQPVSSVEFSETLKRNWVTIHYLVEGLCMRTRRGLNMRGRPSAVRQSPALEGSSYERS